MRLRDFLAMAIGGWLGIKGVKMVVDRVLPHK